MLRTTKSSIYQIPDKKLILVYFWLLSISPIIKQIRDVQTFSCQIIVYKSIEEGVNLYGVFVNFVVDLKFVYKYVNSTYCFNVSNKESKICRTISFVVIYLCELISLPRRLILTLGKLRFIKIVYF